MLATLPSHGNGIIIDLVQLLHNDFVGLPVGNHNVDSTHYINLGGSLAHLCTREGVDSYASCASHIDATINNAYLHIAIVDVVNTRNAGRCAVEVVEAEVGGSVEPLAIVAHVGSGESECHFFHLAQ